MTPHAIIALISTWISRASAAVLGIGGLGLLFAPEAILPRLITGFPPAGSWLGQLVAAGWLAVAMLNWASQPGLLGGIYGRPVVLTNSMLYFVSCTVLIRVALSAEAPAWIWPVVIIVTALTAVYAWLLFRGPFERDFQHTARSS